MKLKIFSIRDSKVDAFMRPFFAQTTKEALRIFEDSVNNVDSGFFKHPDDYCLYEVGSFDPLKGTLEPLINPQSLGLAVEFIKQLSFNASSQEPLPFAK